MSQPQGTPQDSAPGGGAETPPPAPSGPDRFHHEHVRTDSEVRVDDELGSGENRH